MAGRRSSTKEQTEVSSTWVLPITARYGEDGVVKRVARWCCRAQDEAVPSPELGERSARVWEDGRPTVNGTVAARRGWGIVEEVEAVTVVGRVVDDILAGGRNLRKKTLGFRNPSSQSQGGGGGVN